MHYFHLTNSEIELPKKSCQRATPCPGLKRHQRYLNDNDKSGERKGKNHMNFN